MTHPARAAAPTQASPQTPVQDFDAASGPASVPAFGPAYGPASGPAFGPAFGPLASLKVLTLGQLIAGPFAGKTLADFGADVIKVEAPATDASDGGDPLRKCRWRRLHNGISVWWQLQSRNQRSVVLDLRTDAGRTDARRLATKADVVIENFKPGTLEKWGLGYDALAADYPGLVRLRISGHGQTGPYRDLPGFAVVAEAMGGLRHLMGEPGRVPVRAGVRLGDTLAGLHNVIGVQLTLQARTRSVSADAPKDRGLVLAVPGIVPKLSAKPGAIRSLAPTLGQHTAEVLDAWRTGADPPPAADGSAR